MTKYRNIVLQMLDKKHYFSTNGIVRKIKREHKKTVNWYLVFHVLRDLENEGKAEQIETETGFMWRLKNKSNSAHQ